MSEQWESLTKKYAQAFLNLYSSQLSDQIIEKTAACQLFFNEHKNIHGYLILSTVSFAEKSALLGKICAAFSLPSPFNQLSLVLARQGRIDLFPLILQKIILGYRAEKDIHYFTIATSHPIGEHEKSELVCFIEKKVARKIIVDFIVDSSLICGIKIKSDTLAWERSIAKQLKNIKLEALQQVQI